MAPVPRSADNRNHHRHLMNIQPIRRQSHLSPDSVIVNSHNYGGDPNEGQVIGDSSSIQEKGVSRNDVAVTAAGARDPVETSSFAPSEKKISVASTTEVNQRPGTHGNNQFLTSTVSTPYDRVVSADLPPFDNIKSDPTEKNSPIVSSILGISDGNSNNVVTKMAGASILSPTPKGSDPSPLITPSLSSLIRIGDDVSNNRSIFQGNGNVPRSHTTSFASKLHGIRDGSLAIPDTSMEGRKRNLPAEALSPTGVTSLNSSMSQLNRRGVSLPMGLRNKKMKATDCLLFAATLLERGAAEALRAASNNNAPSSGAPSFTNGLPCATRTPSVTKAKPMKKMVCEKVERSLQEAKDAENKPKEADVLCGRGGKVNKHPGNIVYRKVVEYNKCYYQSVHKKHRILVSQSIVKAILNYGGRFMGQKGKEWSPIGFKRAVQKTSQALRERSTSDLLKGVQRMVDELDSNP